MQVLAFDQQWVMEHRKIEIPAYNEQWVMEHCKIEALEFLITPCRSLAGVWAHSERLQRFLICGPAPVSGIQCIQVRPAVSHQCAQNGA